MASETDICNRALSRLGQGRLAGLVTDTSDTSKARKACDDAYETIRNEVLRSHPWNCLGARVQLKAGVITAATLANPVVLTVEAHGFLVGDEIYIEGVLGMTELNGLRYVVSARTTDTVTLTNAHGVALGSLSCTTAIGSKNLVVPDSTVLLVGEVIAGTGIPAGTKITARSSATTVQMDAAATATGSPTCAAGGYTAYTSAGTAKIKPLFGYGQAFRLPTTYWRVLEIVDSTLPWVVEKKILYSDEASTLDVRYVDHPVARAATDPVDNNYDALFISALAARLAVELCEELTQSNTKKQEMKQDYAAILNTAMKIDAQESSPMPFQEDNWVNVRRGR